MDPSIVLSHYCVWFQFLIQFLFYLSHCKFETCKQGSICLTGGEFNTSLVEPTHSGANSFDFHVSMSPLEAENIGVLFWKIERCFQSLLNIILLLLPIITLYLLSCRYLRVLVLMHCLWAFWRFMKLHINRSTENASWTFVIFACRC